MKIPANSLEAFLAVARTGKFSRAGEHLGISQSALSQRILNLESQLETTLFVRERNGSRLTPEGEELLRHAQRQEALEEEFLLSRTVGSPGLSGSLRVGSFSSFTRSIVMPALAPLGREFPVRMSIFSRELQELPELLRKGEADLVVLDQALDREGVSALLLGIEENVLVRSKRFRNTRECYLDHDADDQTTYRYLQKFGQKGKRPERRFFDDVYGLLDGVKLGLGLAILPRHLIEEERDIEIVEPEKILKIQAWLNFPAQAYYPKLHLKARELLVAHARSRLAQR